MESTLVKASKEQVELINGELVGEASRLGLEPGDWPLFIMVLDEQNAGFLFQRENPDLAEGEVAGYHYRSKGGVALLVIND